MCAAVEDLLKMDVILGNRLETVRRVAGGLSESAKIDLREKLFSNNRLHRLLVEFLNVTRDTESVCKYLLCVYPNLSYALVQLKWLYTTPDIVFVKDSFLSTALPQFSYGIQLKILFNIAKYTKDVNYGDHLYGSLVLKNSQQKKTLLAACSNEKILECLTAEATKGRWEISPTQIAIILEKRFETGCALVEEFFKLGINSGVYHEAIRFIQSKDLNRAYGLMKKYNYKGVSLSRRSLREVLERFKNENPDEEDLKIMHRSSRTKLLFVKRYAAPKIFAELWYRRAAEGFTEDLASKLSRPEVFRLLEGFFKRKYGGSIIDNYKHVTYQMINYFPEELAVEVITEKVKNEECGCFDEIFWKFALWFMTSGKSPYAVNVHKLVNKTASESERSDIRASTIESALAFRNTNEAIKAFIRFSERIKNENGHVINSFAGKLKDILKAHKKVEDEHWPHYQKVLELCYSLSSCWNLSGKLLSTVYEYLREDQEYIIDFTAQLLASEDPFWCLTVFEVKGTPHVGRHVIYKKILRKCEPLVKNKGTMKKYGTEYIDFFAKIANLWHQKQINLEALNLRDFPNTLNFLKQRILFDRESKPVYSDQSVSMMMQFLTDSERQHEERRCPLLPQKSFLIREFMSKKTVTFQDFECILKASRQNWGGLDTKTLMQITQRYPTGTENFIQKLSEASTQAGSRTTEHEDINLLLNRYMSTEEFSAYFSRLLPSKVDAKDPIEQLLVADEQKKFLVNLQHRADVNERLQYIAHFMGTDTLWPAIRALECAAMQSPARYIEKFCDDIIQSDTKQVSILKPILRYKVLYSDLNEKTMMELTRRIEHGSAKAVLLEALYEAIGCGNHDKYPIFIKVLQTVNGEQEQAADLLYENTKLDCILDGENFESLLLAIRALPFERAKKLSTTSFFRRIYHQQTKLSTAFLKKIIATREEDDLSLDMITVAAVYASRLNSEEMFDFLKLMRSRKNYGTKADESICEKLLSLACTKHKIGNSGDTLGEFRVTTEKLLSYYSLDLPRWLRHKVRVLLSRSFEKMIFLEDGCEKSEALNVLTETLRSALGTIEALIQEFGWFMLSEFADDFGQKMRDFCLDRTLLPKGLLRIVLDETRPLTDSQKFTLIKSVARRNYESEKDIPDEMCAVRERINCKNNVSLQYLRKL